MPTSLVAGVNEFTEYSISKFFDSDVLNEEKEFLPKTDSYFEFSNMFNASITTIINRELLATKFRIYVKIYWINEIKNTLTISKEIYHFNLFDDYDTFSAFVINLYKKYSIISEEAIFYILIHEKLVAANLLAKSLCEKVNNLKYQKETTNYIMKKFNDYISIPF